MKKQILLLSLLVSSIWINGFPERNIQLKTRECIEDICIKIASEGALRIYIRGIEFSDSIDLVLYRELLSICTDYELFDLTNHKCSLVKAYAYCGLVERNKNMLMEAIRKHQNDTSTVPYERCQYDAEIFAYQCPITQLAIEIAYWGYVYQTTATLNKKDWKYIEGKYKKSLLNTKKTFGEKRVVIKGKAENSYFLGAKIKLEDGRYYFIKGKRKWEEEVLGKEIQVSGLLILEMHFRKLERGENGILIQNKFHPFLKKQLEVLKLEVINKTTL